MINKWNQIWPDRKPALPKKVFVNGIELPPERRGVNVLLGKLADNPMSSVERETLLDPSRLASRLDARNNLHSDSTARAIASHSSVAEVYADFIKHGRSENVERTIATGNRQKQEQKAIWVSFVVAHMNDPAVLEMSSDYRQVRRLQNMMRAAGIEHPATHNTIRDELRILRNRDQK